MKKANTRIAAAILLGSVCSGSLAGCGADQSIKTTAETTSDAANRHSKGYYSIIDRLYDEKKGTNIVISDRSIHIALGMIAAGASGQTKNELEQYIGENETDFADKNKQLLEYYQASGDDETSGTVDIANSIWVNQEIQLKQSYTEYLQDRYQAQSASLDFADESASDVINAWCSDRTEGKICNIIDHDTLQQQEILLINAMYFDDQWMDPFDEKNTSCEAFYNLDGSVSEVDMMNSSDAGYLENDVATGFIKYYADGIAFVGILPKTEGDFAVNDLNIRDLLLTEGTIGADASIKLPKFQNEYSASLADSLKAAGIQAIFEDNAQLNGISDTQIKISDILHKTYISVNEAGTEAAAVTEAQFITGAMLDEGETKEVYLNRPFAFVIYDTNTEDFLFTGKVVHLN